MPVEHGLALFIFIGRVGDICSTQLVTPTLLLEANPLVRRFKRPMFALGFLLCAVPYLDVGLGVMVAVPSLLVTASNLSRAWMARTLGEAEMQALILRAASRGSLPMGLAFAWGTAAFFVLTASLLWWLSADDDIAWCFATGIALYGIIFALHSSLFFLRVFRKPPR